MGKCGNSSTGSPRDMPTSTFGPDRRMPDRNALVLHQVHLRQLPVRLEQLRQLALGRTERQVSGEEAAGLVHQLSGSPSVGRPTRRVARMRVTVPSLNALPDHVFFMRVLSF